ncbi:formate dehydrogenase alpha subunit [Pseudonocardia thermophila]|uniref:Formate dehydrogenase alpha subunit n=1 Tax=Pseudonocardia thermophila TaxID=1848 RepID=A0A1M6Z723_PSETH|nr:formate dehydrogenase subunit alpha [Pseudonocardia thermophila]SHL26205.1 formate dehydrogenase alpha subunit [Pseudonocardia thermophila]
MSLLKEPDYGTPARPGAATVEVTVDGVPVTVPPGTSVMRAAKEAGIDVPKLCATDSLEAFGSCRLCLVEIDGVKGTPASCTTPCTDGMVVRTQTERLAKLRRGVMELYISDHPLDCLTCSANGDCELQDMAGVTGLREVRYGSGVDAGANHMDLPTDTSNPYFQFEASKCIVCSRCVRACDEVQGTLALTIEGRGFDSKVSPGGTDFLSSECVSCGACVQACPTATLQEKSVVDLGMPTRTVITTCAYCGVGCSFKAELRGDELVRMVPYKDGGANEGHSCVKGRFAFGYATHPDRVLTPLMRESIADEWREATWDEAISFVARRLREIQAEHGPGAIGAITSSRCTNEEVYVVQKMVRAAFGNNNVDTCARVCHSPTGYGLKQTFGTSAGTQDFKSVADADVIMIIGANPTDGHPVFASRMKRRLREGARLIVIDPRRIDMVRSPHIRADHHLALAPGTNVAIINAMAHVVVTEGLVDEEFVAERCEGFEEWAEFIARPENSPEAVEAETGVPAADVRAAARLYATGGNAAIYYGLGVTEHSQGSTMVMGLANLAMATGNIGRSGVGVNPLRGQNNVQGSCDMGSFPHELPGYRHVGDESVRDIYNELWGVSILDEPGLRIPNMFDAALDGTFRALYVQGEDIAQSDPNTQHVHAALAAMDLVVVQDLFLNETSKFAHVLLPGTSFLEKDGTFTNAERRINRVRPVMAPRTGKHEWEIVCEVAQAMGYPMRYSHPSEIMDEIALTTPTFAGVSFAKLDEVGSVQWPCNEKAPLGTPIMHVDGFVRGKGKFIETPYVPTPERSTRKYPLILTTGRILTQYNVGAQTRRTANTVWHPEDVLELHPHDAEVRGISDGDVVRLSSRVGQTTLRAVISDRMPVGVCYTTFHHPVTGANVVTTEHSDWATNCPEYKVTAVQVELITSGRGAEAGLAAVPVAGE